MYSNAWNNKRSTDLTPIKQSAKSYDTIIWFNTSANKTYCNTSNDLCAYHLLEK